jgi:hypothetical protein
VKINKITSGFVVQTYDTQTGRCVEQSFIADDDVAYEDRWGDAVDWREKEDAYQPFDMLPLRGHPTDERTAAMTKSLRGAQEENEAVRAELGMYKRIVQWFCGRMHVTAPKMDGSHWWRFHNPTLRGPTPLAAIRQRMEQEEKEQETE